MKCAIGALIKDEFYEPSIEHNSVWSASLPIDIMDDGETKLRSAIYKSLNIKGLSKREWEFLSDLQALHDIRTREDSLLRNKSREVDYRDRLTKFAEENGLIP